MSRLVRLYPDAWRSRYEIELVAAAAFVPAWLGVGTSLISRPA